MCRPSSAGVTPLFHFALAAGFKTVGLRCTRGAEIFTPDKSVYKLCFSFALMALEISAKRKRHVLSFGVYYVVRIRLKVPSFVVENGAKQPRSVLFQTEDIAFHCRHIYVT